jgi:ABC-type transporter Mla maintaining outer membrane lipid asymmetry ATPase subunit MlaF
MSEGIAPAMAVRDLTKRFDDCLALGRVRFEVRAGELFGFLGPNGAGKTTTINLLTGLARPSRGTVHFLGRDYTHPAQQVQHPWTSPLAWLAVRAPAGPGSLCTGEESSCGQPLTSMEGCDI